MILLDTHAFVWLASAPGELSTPAADAIKRHLGDLAISIVSTWEIALLVRKGRLRLPVSADEFIARAIQHHGITELPLTRVVILNAVDLEPIHNDPFDRILIAEAQQYGCEIVTKDRYIPQYGVKVVW